MGPWDTWVQDTAVGMVVVVGGGVNVAVGGTAPPLQVVPFSEKLAGEGLLPL